MIDTININKATKKQLEQIPGIGPTLAQRIIEAREKKSTSGRGDFIKDDLFAVKGLNKKKINKICEYVVFESIKTQKLEPASKPSAAAVRKIAIAVSLFCHILSPLLFLMALYFAYEYVHLGYAVLTYILCAYLWGVARQKTGMLSFLFSLIAAGLYAGTLNPIVLLCCAPAIVIVAKIEPRANIFAHDSIFAYNFKKERRDNKQINIHN